VLERLHAAWASILNVPTNQPRFEVRSDDIRGRVAAAFDAPRAGWVTARQHSPDVMIAASSVEAFSRGDFVAVLGEVHVASNTMETALAVAHHPAPSDLVRAMAADISEPRAVFVGSKDALRTGSRGCPALVSPADFEIEAGFDTMSFRTDRSLRIADLVVEDLAGELRVRAADASVDLDLRTVMAGSLTLVVINALEMLPPQTTHTPRVTIDRLVVKRESWRFAPPDPAVLDGRSESEKFLAARRWARRHGMPRFVFVKSSLEVKPIYVDFDSPLTVALLARLVRKAREHPLGKATITVSEMLPSLEQAWLPDAEGNRYTSELRFVAVDQRR
jgi:hypothetical protein